MKFLLLEDSPQLSPDVATGLPERDAAYNDSQSQGPRVSSNLVFPDRRLPHAVVSAL